MTHYDIAIRFPDSAFGSKFLRRWRMIMNDCLQGKSAISREHFFELHRAACKEAAHWAMEVLR